VSNNYHQYIFMNSLTKSFINHCMCGKKSITPKYGSIGSCGPVEITWDKSHRTIQIICQILLLTMCNKNEKLLQGTISLFFIYRIVIESGYHIIHNAVYFIGTQVFTKTKKKMNLLLCVSHKILPTGLLYKISLVILLRRSNWNRL